jgi:hypothetical protein
MVRLGPARTVWYGPYASGMASQLFEEFSERIAALPDGRLTTGDLMTDAFVLDREGELAVYYVPCEQKNRARGWC